MTYVLTYSTTDEDAFGEMLVTSWNTSPSIQEIMDTDTMTYTQAKLLILNGVVFYNDRRWILRENKCITYKQT